MAASVATATRGNARLTSIGTLGVVVISIALSVLSYGPLGETVRIRWTIGASYHYGPEYISTLVALVAFPVFIAGLYAGMEWFKTYLERSGEIDDNDQFAVLYDVLVMLLLGVVVAVQFILIGLNLWAA